jgi:tight adherence protein B
VRPLDLVAASAIAALAVGGAGWVLFGNVPALVAGVAVGAALPTRRRHRDRERRLATAREAWPGLIDELRVLTDAGGQSVPVALFSLIDRVPPPLAPAFAEARREWMLRTDFGRALTVLRDRLEDPTVDALCETLDIAHAMGGPGLSRRLADLAEDRRADVAARRDARARMAGARFARRFVLLVPLGMAAAGLAVGPGRAAYTTPLGQAATALGLALVALCWWWAGRMMVLPEGAGAVA